LNGRSFFSLVTFGFAPAAQAPGRPGGSRGSLTIAISGGRSTWQNFTLDGITNTDINFNTYILQPSVEALQEFKVEAFTPPNSATPSAKSTSPSSQVQTRSTVP